MLLKPALVVADIDYLALALALIPPVLATPVLVAPVPHFCAARLPLPQLAAHPFAATADIGPPPAASTAPLLLALHDPLDALLLLEPGDCLDWLCTDLVPPASPSPSPSPSATTPAPRTSSSRVLTVSRVFSRQNNKLVLLCKISYPAPRGWRQESTLVVAKLRLSRCCDAWREHDDELAMLRAVGASCSRAMFPTLLGMGQFAGRRPLLLMSYIPHPSITDILRGPVAAEAAYNAGDKTVFHDDEVLRGGMERAVRALRAMGLRHGDLKGANVVYRVATGDFVVFPLGRGEGVGDKGVKGRVWLVDMESVAGLVREKALPGETEKAGDEREVQEILSNFWKYELCCADGGCRQSGGRIGWLAPQ